MAQPWEGFWQVLYDTADEDVVPFRNTTIAVRAKFGVVVLTRSHFIQIHVLGKRQGPVGWPPTEPEAVEMLRTFQAHGGPCDWETAEGQWEAEQRIEMASDPRLEGTTVRGTFEFDGDRCRCQRTLPDGMRLDEIWRRLSGAGTSPLAGAWETRGPAERWFYLVTAGHYGVMRVAHGRPRTPAQGEHFSDAEMYALWNAFGANAGARVETERTFDHWPMVAQVPGYEVRKHETFRIESIEKDRFVASFPPDGEPGEPWRRVE